MSSETVTVYIAGVLPGHKSFDAPIVAEAQARKTAKFFAVFSSDTSFHKIAGWNTRFAHNVLSTTRLGAVQKYLAQCNTKLTEADQRADAAQALLDYEIANLP